MLEVTSFQRENVLSYNDQYAGFGVSGSSTYTLDRITTNTGLTLFEVAEVGGCLAEDGDSWENYAIYDNEYEARAEYRKDILTILTEVLTSAARYLDNGYFSEVAEAWPGLAEWAKATFNVNLPLQSDFRLAQAGEEPATPDGWAMYLKGFAKWLGELI